MHAGDVDVLVGTQMIAKGHDFRRITLVAAVNPDGALFCERLPRAGAPVRLLMQAAGRAGRDAGYLLAQAATAADVDPDLPSRSMRCLPRCAGTTTRRSQHGQLAERAAAGLPPFAFLALLRADARAQEAAQGFPECRERGGRGAGRRRSRDALLRRCRWRSSAWRTSSVHRC